MVGRRLRNSDSFAERDLKAFFESVGDARLTVCVTDKLKVASQLIENCKIFTPLEGHRFFLRLETDSGMKGEFLEINPGNNGCGVIQRDKFGDTNKILDEAVLIKVENSWFFKSSRFKVEIKLIV